MSAIPAGLSRPSPWQHALPALLALLGVILVLYRETAMVMVQTWYRSETFAHAFLVLPISLWLIWGLRKDLAARMPRPQPWVLVPMLVVALVWLVADLAMVNAGAQFMLVSLLVLTVPAVLGLDVTRVMLFPLLFLFFAVPFGDFLLPLMMDWTASFTIAALRLSGIPVYREGMQFVIPSGSWSVVEACSGVRYLIASFMVGTLFAHLNFRSTKRRVVFMLASLLLPIIANWLRAYMIVMLGHLSSNTLAVGVDHLIYGWVFFGVVIGIMFFVGTRWAEPPLLGEALSSAQQSHTAPVPAGRRYWALMAGASLLVLLPQVAVMGLQRLEGEPPLPRLELPIAMQTWVAVPGDGPAWRPHFGSPSIAQTRQYRAGDHEVGVYIAYYRSQGGDRRLVSSGNMFVRSDDKHWHQVSSGRQPVDLGDQRIEVSRVNLLGNSANAAGARQRITAWRFYWIDGHFVGGDAAAKLAGVVARLRGHGDDGAAIVLHVSLDADLSTDAANDALRAFMAANHTTMDTLLRKTREMR